MFSSQDFSNQVRYSTAYAAELKKHDAAPGRYVRPATAEFFSGLRKMSKSCFNMMVSLLPSKQDSRLLGQASKPMRCPGNSSLRCFLCNVRRPECSFHRMLIVEHAWLPGSAQNGRPVTVHRSGRIGVGAFPVENSATQSTWRSLSFSFHFF